jgi:hypothetical protein
LFRRTASACIRARTGRLAEEPPIILGRLTVDGDNLATAGAGLATELANDGRFGEASAGLHAPFNDLSYKSNDYPQGNIQFSFNKDRTGVDVDHDLFVPGLRHFFEEVVVNSVTGSKTDQDAVRRMLIQNPKIGITPSPDPKFNRPQ